MQLTLNNSTHGDETLEDSIQRIRDAGYLVIPMRALDPVAVHNAPQLLDFFYNYMQYKRPNRKIHYAKSLENERAWASNLIKQRKKVTGSKKRALQEAVNIVKCVIDNEELFSFNQPVSSFIVLRGGKFRWVIDRAISIINGEYLEKEEQDLENLYSEKDKKYERLIGIMNEE